MTSAIPLLKNFWKRGTLSYIKDERQKQFVSYIFSILFITDQNINEIKLTTTFLLTKLYQMPDSTLDLFLSEIYFHICHCANIISTSMYHFVAILSLTVRLICTSVNNRIGLPIIFSSSSEHFVDTIVGLENKNIIVQTHSEQKSGKAKDLQKVELLPG